MSQDFFEYHIETMKEKYPTFGKYQNYHIFTLLCIKYFFIVNLVFLSTKM